LDRAEVLDRADPLRSYRDRFYLPSGRIYLDGNSLGLASRNAEIAILAALESWKTLGIDGWLRADPPWFTLGEELSRLQADLVGARPGEVAVGGSTTVNLHALVASFYRPKHGRSRIVVDALNFPSDLYALRSQLRLRGQDPDRDLVLVSSRDGRTIEEDDVVAVLTDDVALVVLPSVLYRSGQLLDLERLTRAAREQDIPIGFDLSHSAGSVPHQLHDW
jgi:kynureninase